MSDTTAQGLHHHNTKSPSYTHSRNGVKRPGHGAHLRVTQGKDQQLTTFRSVYLGGLTIKVMEVGGDCA